MAALASKESIATDKLEDLHDRVQRGAYRHSERYADVVSRDPN
jgi:hypothetical protein